MPKKQNLYNFSYSRQIQYLASLITRYFQQFPSFEPQCRNWWMSRNWIPSCTTWLLDYWLVSSQSLFYRTLWILCPTHSAGWCWSVRVSIFYVKIYHYNILLQKQWTQHCYSAIQILCSLVLFDQISMRKQLFLILLAE